MELARIAGFDHVGGRDMRNAASLYAFTSFEASIFDDCVAALSAYFDDPLSPEGIALTSHLKYWETRWNLAWYYA